MQLPDESIAYSYQNLMISAIGEWTPIAELRKRHYLDPARLRAMVPELMQVKSQVATERELQQVPPELMPLDAGFIDLPRSTLDEHRRKGETSVLGRILTKANHLRSQVDRVVVLGIGGSYLGVRALFESLCSSYHNELSPEARIGTPRIYFEGNNVDNDALSDLIELLQTTCVDPEIREERWALIVISKSGGTLETAAAYRVFHREAAEFYGAKSDHLSKLIIPVTGGSGKLHDLCVAEGYKENDILRIPENVGGRYSVFSAAGLMPAAV